MSTGKTSTPALLDQIEFYIERNRFPQAESIVSELLLSEPDNTDALYYAAYLRYATERYEEAEDILNRALQIDPGDPDIRLLLARTFRERLQFASSEKVIIGLIKESPRNPHYYSFYALLMLTTLNTEKAGRLAEEALALAPGHVQARIVSVFCDVINGEGAAADEKMKALLRDHPESEHVVASLVSLLVERGKFREALQISRDLVWNNPSDEDYVEMVRDLRVKTHLTTIPLLPLMKYGWPMSAALWLAAVASIYLSQVYLPDDITFAILLGWLCYVVYSWVYPGILRKILG